MPEEGFTREPASNFLNFEELRRLVRVLSHCGINRVRITGGEPLVRRELPTLVRMIADLPKIDEVVLTTNGVLLTSQAGDLRDAGLAGLTVSLDSLQPARFASMSRGGDLEAVLRGIEAAVSAGFEGVKINTVVVRGVNDDELHDLATWAWAAGHTPRFIEFMPIGAGTVWGHLPGGGCVPAAELRGSLGSRWHLEPQGMIGGAGPSRYYTVSGSGVPAGARVGFISAVTECFCDACNRIRLTPQGGIRACLADDAEVDLRALLRNGAADDELVAAVALSLSGKKRAHQFDIQGGAVTVKGMISIGG
jgi:cyclic pyranopterin phosphate synthase